MWRCGEYCADLCARIRSISTHSAQYFRRKDISKISHAQGQAHCTRCTRCAQQGMEPVSSRSRGPARCEAGQNVGTNCCVLLPSQISPSHVVILLPLMNSTRLECIQWCIDCNLSICLQTSSIFAEATRRTKREKENGGERWHRLFELQQKRQPYTHNSTSGHESVKLLCE